MKLTLLKPRCDAGAALGDTDQRVIGLDRAGKSRRRAAIGRERESSG